MPAVELPDGRWMTDTTKMIQWFENELKENTILPEDPVQSFICFLIEDWADEWWWRPAMHYRWHYKKGADFASNHLSRELFKPSLTPVWLRKILLKRRQRNGYTVGDGVSKENIKSIEKNVINLFENLDKIFSKRRFIFGDRPSLADIGLSGPFFRHFALDPIPLEIIKNDYPNILKWLDFLWHTKISDDTFVYLKGIPDDLEPLLYEIGNTYLPYLCSNVSAIKKQKKFFDFSSGEMHFKNARYSQYRIWCLKELQDQYKLLPEESKREGKKILKKFKCWTPLWEHKDLLINSKQEKKLPFWADRKMLGVYE
jgi:glutathione S-transferase